MIKQIFEDLFENDYKNFKGYLRSRFNTLSEYDAEDIIQQTVLKLLYKGDDVLSINNLTSYMYTSLRNGAIDHMRKRKYEVMDIENVEAKTRSLEEEILSLELKRIIKEAIDLLDKKSKFIFVETEIKGRSYKEIMAQTNEKLGTLLARKSRAMKKLQNILKEYVCKEAKK